MPRPNPLREILGERALARRVAYERERRGMSTEGLARRMTEVGCPMHQSAIWKIENADPPRRITYDEAIAFARVFETPLEDLAVVPEVAASEEVRGLVAELEETDRRLCDGLIHWRALVERLQAVVDEFPSAGEVPGPLAELLVFAPYLNGCPVPSLPNFSTRRDPRAHTRTRTTALPRRRW